MGLPGKISSQSLSTHRMTWELYVSGCRMRAIWGGMLGKGRHLASSAAQGSITPWQGGETEKGLASGTLLLLFVWDPVYTRQCSSSWVQAINAIRVNKRERSQWEILGEALREAVRDWNTIRSVRFLWFPFISYLSKWWCFLHTNSHMSL